MPPNSSNRTIVGLKHEEKRKKAFEAIKQQSHHCGIETVSADKFARIQQICSNRTIVGLKPKSGYLPVR